MTPAIGRRFYRFVGGNTTIPVTLGLRNIYILPTGFGLLYLMGLGAMLIGSINYNNNLGFLLTFLLGSLGLTAMMHTYRMLYGLRLTGATAMPVFAGESAEVNVTLSGIDRSRRCIHLYFDAADNAVAHLGVNQPNPVKVRAPANHRGYCQPGRLRIACEYPLGLFQAWARINTGLIVLAYPRPVSGPRPITHILPDFGEGQVAPTTGVDDFQGLSAYQPGDPPGRIHWQAYSRGRGLHTKTFAGQAGAGLMLDLKEVKGYDTEGKLSILCFHVVRAYHHRISYGLKLAEQTIPAGIGRGHRDRCLRALALYGKS